MPKSMGTIAKHKAKLKLIETQGMVCYYCGDKLIEPKHVMTQQESNRLVTIEHILPLRRGGGNNIENLVLACLACNMSKGNKTEKEYRNYLEGARNGK